MNTTIPRHVAIIMDGNGRWGEQRGLTRSEGHYAGTQAMENIIDACIDFKIEVVTLYAFSSENWARPKDEVNYLMLLPIRFFKKKLPAFMRRNIRVTVSGDMDTVPKATRDAVTRAVEQTKSNTGLIANFAFNYGGRNDIVQAMRTILIEVQNNNIDVEHVDEQLFKHYLYTKELPDPDLLIRTGGEKRMSNFLLWQAPGAELYFTDTYFPDFTKELLKEALLEYTRRQPVYTIG